MHGPDSQPTSGALLLFALFLGPFGLYLLATGAYVDGGLALAVAIALGAYSRLLRPGTSRWDRLWLALGLAAGVVAFGLAVVLST